MVPDFRRGIHRASDIKAKVASIDIEGEALVDLSGEQPCIKAELSMGREKISDLLESLSSLSGLLPGIGTIRTDAEIRAQ